MTRTLLFLIGFFAMVATSASGEPAIEFTHDTFNFGKTVQQVVLTHDFWIKSTGDAPLEILEVVPGCGCTKSTLSDSIIAPGDSASLHIVFSSGRFRGNVSKRPYLRTNVSEENIYLKIFAELEINPAASTPAVLTPSAVDVSQFDERPRRKARFTLENVSDVDQKLTVVDSTGKSFTVEIDKKIKKGEAVQGIITVNEDAMGTEFEESITLELVGKERVRYSVPVKRMLQGTAKPK